MIGVSFSTFLCVYLIGVGLALFSCVHLIGVGFSIFWVFEIKTHAVVQVQSHDWLHHFNFLAK